jgi:hypothetical protein
VRTLRLKVDDVAKECADIPLASNPKVGPFHLPEPVGRAVVVGRVLDFVCSTNSVSLTTIPRSLQTSELHSYTSLR